MKVFLSIDLDYFCWDTYQKSSKSFFERILKLRLPILVTEEHEQIVNYVNSFEFNELWNIDFHDDFMGYKDTEFPEDYNWVDFVDLKDKYKWFYPSFQDCYKNYLGRCNPLKQNPWILKYRKTWKNVSRKCGLPSKLETKNIVAISITKSPRFTEDHTVEHILKKLDIYNGSSFDPFIFKN